MTPVQRYLSAQRDAVREHLANITDDEKAALVREADRLRTSSRRDRITRRLRGRHS